MRVKRGRATGELAAIDGGLLGCPVDHSTTSMRLTADLKPDDWQLFLTMGSYREGGRKSRASQMPCAVVS
jgi:hypothetical protein